VPDAAERIGADHSRVLEESTAAAHDAGEFERGIALATSALKELDPATEPERVAKLLGDRGHFKMKLGRKDFARDLEDALQYVPADVSPAIRVDILLALAHCPPKVTNERSYAEEALALAQQAGDEAKEANALLTLAMFNADPGQQAPLDSGPLDLIAQARAMAERRGADEVLLHAAVNESHLLEGAGEHERAAEAARRATVSADPQLLSRTSGSVLAINQAEPLGALGRWDEALKITTGAMDLYLAPAPMHRALLQVIAGSIALARGNLAAASQTVMAARDALSSARYEDQHQLALAKLEILFALGRDGPAAGLAAASQTMDRFELSVSSPRYAWPVVAAGASTVLAAAGLAGVAHDERLRDEAAAIAERLRTVAEKLETFGPAQRAFQLTFAAADAHGGRLLAAFPGANAGVGADAGQPEGVGGEPVELLAAWDEAAAAWAILGEPYPLSETLLHAAETALACGDRDGAAERLRRAVPLASELGAHPLAEQITILARRARIRLTGDDASEGQVPGDPGAGGGELGLTERELEVLRLVAAGRSNREIAAELFISPKTASVHVSNILGKLSVASRGEAAAKVHTLRLFDPASTT
jgi:ATP/maltotriose-dependent transcriptional regulator MalT